MWKYSTHVGVAAGGIGVGVALGHWLPIVAVVHAVVHVLLGLPLP